MLDILDSFLADATTPEMKQVVAEACVAFDLMGLDDYETTYTNTLLMDDNRDSGETLALILRHTRDFQCQILLEHGIVAEEDCSMEMRTRLIDGLMLIQMYQDVTTIHRIGETDLNPEEMFAEFLSLVLPLTVEELLPILASVEPSAVKRIAELQPFESESIEPDTETLQEKDLHVVTYQHFCTTINKEVLLVEQLLVNGMAIGYDFKTYADVVGHLFETMLNDDIAETMVGFAIISSDGIHNPRGIIKENLEHYIHDIDRATRIDIRVNELILGLNR